MMTIKRKELQKYIPQAHLTKGRVSGVLKQTAGNKPELKYLLAILEWKPLQSGPPAKDPLPLPPGGLF